MRFIPLALALCAVQATPALAQANLPRCSADMTAQPVPSPLLDGAGYPLQQAMAASTITITRTQPCLDRYVFMTDFGPVVAPDARIVYSGTWERIGQRRVARSGVADEFSYSSSLSISEETAHEINASLGVSAMAAFKPLGVGVEVTVEASVGYALTMASGTEAGQEWSHSVTVNPGEEVVLWARRLHVEVEWNPAEAYALGTDIFGVPLRFINETLLPARQQELMLSPDITPGQAERMVAAEAVVYRYNNPIQNALDATRHAVALGLMNEFLRVHPGPIRSSYELPARETYVVRYTF